MSEILEPRFERWVAAWHAAVAASRAKHAAAGTTPDRHLVRVGGPASDHEIDAVEATLPAPIPAAMRRLFSWARAVDVWWFLPRDQDPPAPFDGIFSGECHWSLDDLGQLFADYRSWIENVFPDPADPYDRVWHGKFPFAQIVNGDLLAIDPTGAVIYLSHDDGQEHGYRLGDDAIDFIERSTALGCPGAEGWQWLPFTSGPASGLETDGANARAWRDWFGLRFDGRGGLGARHHRVP